MTDVQPQTGIDPPQHKYRRAGLTSAGEVPDGLINFAKLPDAARVRQPVVEGLFSISGATVWRWVRAGILPAPHRCGGITSWVVSEIRASMAEMGK